MNVVETSQPVLPVANMALNKAALPCGLLRSEAMGETALNELNGAFDGNAQRRDEQVNVVGHDDESVEQVLIAFAVVLEGSTNSSALRVT